MFKRSGRKNFKYTQVKYCKISFVYLTESINNPKAMKYVLAIIICLFSIGSFAQQKQNQFILIIRSKADVKASAADIQNNIKHWQEYMGELGKNGKIAGGYRPANEGVTISGTNKTQKDSAYIANGEIVSSFLIINAADINEAKQIAAKCPVFELQGSVEIRTIRNTAN